ncbi:MAG: ribonuclease P protein component [Leptolyngbyaceae bacterium]|nr:ribonuclease P protein component [Leptolyngbyaceae bacterium]
MSLPAQHRLRHRRDFSKVYRHGERYSSKNLVIRVLKARPSKSTKNCFPQNFSQSASKQSRPLSVEESIAEEVIAEEVIQECGDRHTQVPQKAVSGESDDSDDLPPLHPTRTEPTKVGISVSQKVSKRAVIRNRIKRQLKAAIRSLIPCFNNGWLLVIVVRPSAVQCDYGQFLQELEKTLKLTEVWNGHS